MVTVIDVHTHMLNDKWLQTILDHGGRYSLKELGEQRVIHYDGAPFMTLMDGMFDYQNRIEAMDKAGVDIAVVSLTCPSVYWGGEEVSTATAQMMNDDMANQQSNYPDRIRWFATLPWQYSEKAVQELERASRMGALGVFVSASISGASLTDPSFAAVWDAIGSCDRSVGSVDPRRRGLDAAHVIADPVAHPLEELRLQRRATLFGRHDLLPHVLQ